MEYLHMVFVEPERATEIAGGSASHGTEQRLNHG